MSKESTALETELSAGEVLKVLKSDAGFSAELRAVDVFLQQNISVDPNIFYLDQQSQKFREIDIVARLRKSLSGDD